MQCRVQPQSCKGKLWPFDTQHAINKPVDPTRNDSLPATRVRYGVLGFTLLLPAIAYLDRVCISTAAPAMKLDLGLNDAQMGRVFSAFTFAYALMEVPSGWLADRFGPRLMLARIVIWWSVMTAAAGWAAGFMSLFLIRMLFGIGEAGCFPSMVRADRFGPRLMLTRAEPVRSEEH